MPTQIEVYQFNELDPLVQRRVLNTYRSINVEHPWWNYYKDLFIERLESLGYLNAEPLFSGFYSKGDGACFTAQVDVEGWINAHRQYKKYRALRNQAEYVTLRIVRTGPGHNLYYHEYTMQTSLRIDRLNSRAYDAIDQFEAEVLEDARQLARQYYRLLEKEYDLLTSDDAVISTITHLNWHFTESGVRV